nr:hypothetical protein [uncultured Draconibacterium sp.]
MNFNEIWKVVLGIIASVGGIGVIILCISNYLSKLFADKYLEKVKTDFEIKLESYKSQLEITKTVSLRYSNSQFEEYSKLWASRVISF